MLGSFLAIDTSVDFESRAINLTDNLVSFAIDASDSLRMIGIGIGSILLLIVALYYVTSILDGGKFQMKMLVPIAIFFLVCNFNWIAKPVVFFTTTLTESISRSLYDLDRSIKEKHDAPPDATIGDMYALNQTKSIDGSDDEQVMKDAYSSLTGQDTESEKDQKEDEATPSVTLEKSKKGGKGGMITRSVDKAFNKKISDASKDFSTVKDEKLEHPSSTLFTTLLMIIFGAICSAMSYVFKAFGALMTAIIVAFGPITFAFAIMPGQGGTVKTWFIRLCQFALYSPLCALVNTFSTFLFDFLATQNSGDGAFAMCLGLEICCVVALTSIPSIASMIIEGASGAVSLSQGLQSVGRTIGGAATAAGALYTLGAGRDNRLGNFMQGAKEMGVSGLVRSYREGAASGGSSGAGFSNMFNEATSRGYSQQHYGMERNESAGGSPSGQNNAGNS